MGCGPGLVWGRFQLLLLPSCVQKAFEAWLLQSPGLAQEHIHQHWCQQFWKLAQLLGGLTHSQSYPCKLRPVKGRPLPLREHVLPKAHSSRTFQGAGRQALLLSLFDKQSLRNLFTVAGTVSQPGFHPWELLSPLVLFLCLH